MHETESVLLKNGYLKFVFKFKPMRYEFWTNEIISTMSNLDFRYFHESNPIIDKIKKSLLVENDQITMEDRKGEIIIGLEIKGESPRLLTSIPDHIKSQLK